MSGGATHFNEHTEASQDGSGRRFVSEWGIHLDTTQLAAIDDVLQAAYSASLAEDEHNAACNMAMVQPRPLTRKLAESLDMIRGLYYAREAARVEHEESVQQLLREQS